MTPTTHPNRNKKSPAADFRGRDFVSERMRSVGQGDAQRQHRERREDPRQEHDGQHEQREGDVQWYSSIENSRLGLLT